METATTELAAPIVFDPTKDGSLRFCKDYRKSNTITLRDLYLPRRMDECTDSVGKVTVFSTLDVSSGHWKMYIDERNGDKKAFTCCYGLCRFMKM